MRHGEADKKRSCCAKYADLLFLNRRDENILQRNLERQQGPQLALVFEAIAEVFHIMA